MSSATDWHTFMTMTLDKDSIKSAILRSMLDEKERWAQGGSKDSRDHRMAYSEREIVSWCQPYKEKDVKTVLDLLVSETILECRLQGEGDMHFYRLVR